VGKLIAIEGIDGSGKGSQAALVSKCLSHYGKYTKTIGFPQYGGFFGGLVGDYLNGRMGNIYDIPPIMISTLFAADRAEHKESLSSAIMKYDYVILDRYVSSNIAHQGAKLPEAERSDFIKKIMMMEYSVFGMPMPDIEIVLEMPVDIAMERVKEKQARSYTQLAADIHEADGDYLTKVDAVYKALKDHIRWDVYNIDALGTQDEVCSRILEKIL